MDAAAALRVRLAAVAFLAGVGFAGAVAAGCADDAASAASAVMMAVTLPACFSRSPSLASNSASALPTGRGRLKRLPGESLGSCMGIKDSRTQTAWCSLSKKTGTD